MNTWQVVQQLKKLLTDQKWPGGVADDTVVFGGVHITPAPKERAFDKFQFPVALINPTDATVDPQHGEETNLIDQRIEITVIQSQAGDFAAMGETTLIGSHRTSDENSDGRGLLEIEEELFRAVGLLSAINGVRIVHRASSFVTPILDEDLPFIILRDYLFECLTSTERSYIEPDRLAGTVLGGGAVDLTWLNPPDRYDLFKVELWRKPGTSAPTAPGDGTEVPLGGDLVEAVSDTGIAPGDTSWSLFAWYDDYSETPSVEREVSPPDTLTLTVT